MCKDTGHKMYWFDWEDWKEEQSHFTQEFWEDYRANHKGTGDAVATMVRDHFKTSSKWDRMALNAPTQGTGCIILKEAATQLFNWVVDNGYFGKILFCAFVHDEINTEYPKDLTFYPQLVQNIMLNAAAKYCHSLPIPAEAEVSDHWVH